MPSGQCGPPPGAWTGEDGGMTGPMLTQREATAACGVPVNDPPQP